MAHATDSQQALDALGTRVTGLLAEKKTGDARSVLLEAWRRQRNVVLAELIDAVDLRLRRTNDRWSGALEKGARRTFASTHRWREWFTRDPDDVANRLAIYEELPDPAATRIILELLMVAPPQLLIAERLWSLVERVLIAVADTRVLNSLASFLDGQWPPRRTHLAIQSVPHLQAAMDWLKALPIEPTFVVPEVLEATLSAELQVVRACCEVAPLDQVEDYTQLRRFVETRTPAARILLGDWLAERGDARGLALNSDHEADASVEIDCLRVRAEQRWLSTASHPVLELEVRSGLPYSATIGGDAGGRAAVDPRTFSMRRDSGRSRNALSELWPMWPIIKSVTVEEWDDSLAETLQGVEAVQRLRNVPWRIARTLKLGALEVLRTDEQGAAVAELVRLSPQLREFDGVTVGSLSHLDQLKSIERITLRMPVVVPLVIELATRAIAHRVLRTAWCEHRLTGRNDAGLQVETTVFDDWYRAFGNHEGAPGTTQQLFEQLDDAAQMFRGLSLWRFSAGNADRVEAVAEWINSRGQ